MAPVVIVPTLKKVVPQLPELEEGKELLKEDLIRMGCASLMEVPWGFQEERMVRELMGSPPNQYDGMIRVHPETWTKDTWRQVYSFRKGGSGLTSRKVDYAKDEFVGKIDAKEGTRPRIAMMTGRGLSWPSSSPSFIRRSLPGLRPPRPAPSSVVSGESGRSIGRSSCMSYLPNCSRVFPKPKVRLSLPTLLTSTSTQSA